MKVLWVGDAVVSTGFARCTHAACDALHAAGHEVHLLGFHYYGDPDHGYPYTIWPPYEPFKGGIDAFAVNRLPRMVEKLEPDVVVILQDPWNIEQYLDSLGSVDFSRIQRPLVVGWLAVDGRNQKARHLHRLDHVVVWTEFARDELRTGGYEAGCDVVPLGVDHKLFYPIGKAEARAAAVGRKEVLENAFIVGVVGRNQVRKRVEISISVFARWILSRGIRDAWLYLHTAPTGEQSIDIRCILDRHGVSGRVLLAEPDKGYGVDNELMRSIYSSFDVYMTTTQGEGWGLPALEAMACEVPVIAPDYSGLGSWARGAAVLVPCRAEITHAPVGGNAYVLGGLVDEEAMIVELDAMYRSQAHRATIAKRCRRLAGRFSWDDTGVQMTSVLERLVAARRELLGRIARKRAAELGAVEAAESADPPEGCVTPGPGRVLRVGDQVGAPAGDLGAVGEAVLAEAAGGAVEGVADGE